jgi:hypothetical protein
VSGCRTFATRRYTSRTVAARSNAVRMNGSMSPAA